MPPNLANLNTATTTTTIPPRHPTLSQSYGERSEHSGLTPIAHYLLRLIHVKRTNLCVSADVTTTSQLLRLADQVGDHICVLKTHADIVKDFGDRTIRGLNEIAKRKKFVVFEDRKFGDIGNTVQEQYVGGPLTIVRWAPIVNAHLFPGPAIITALHQAAKDAIAAYNTSVSTDISASPVVSAVDYGNDNESVESDHVYADNDDDDDDDDDDENEDDDEEEESAQDHRSRKQSVVSISTTISTKTEALSPRPTIRPSLSRGSTNGSDEHADDIEDPAQTLEELGPPPFFRSLLLLAQMSSANNFLTPEYTAACVKQARCHKDFVMGFIAQQSLNSDPDDNFITMTPGVQLAAGGDGLGQQYNTPHTVIGNGGSDIIIVGRGILAASDPAKAAVEYRKQGWAAYEERLRLGRKRC